MDKGIDPYRLNDYDFAAFGENMLVLDVGCGKGNVLEKLKKPGCRGIGVEPDPERVNLCKRRGLVAVVGVAEKLPFADATFDGVICKGVIPYTTPEKAFREISRVLKNGGIAQFCYLSSGFYLRYLLVGPEMWVLHRLYGLRTIINTWLFAVTGRRLPGRLGDTTYQSQTQLQRLYATTGFALVQDTPSPRFAGFPVFIYHTLQRKEPVLARSADVVPDQMQAVG